MKIITLVPSILLTLSLRTLPTRGNDLGAGFDMPNKGTAGRGEKLDTANCEHLAKTGFCKIQRSLMDEKCPGECDFVRKYGKQFKKFPKYDARNDSSKFFDIEAKDYRGSTIEFSDFEGYVTLVVNFISDCGFIDESFEVFAGLRRTYPYLLEILAFPEIRNPNNSPAIEECDGINKHARGLGKGKIVVMQESDPNDPKHPVYSYLKPKLGKKDEDLEKDRPTFFLITPNGNLEMHTAMNEDILRHVIDAHVRNDHIKDL
mmetsp:Transcript_42165/g.51355  ORF Transcript_42165/g.51355 Transcript_42165/m.51355 type:complete len:260 (-) Transcript_42165:303-1082(-)|eukprot:CAMPEP_0172485830 /NCGR_PEP_ID=MMETSP1066-20121228/14056_1 /TAXON_ID=671091 /ORGANISM="Coscinodiscus wailesii, Strain CCMP2513" /LENGTH=259 /DNA_ID=CAMNT_0013251339 /DNA_START=74 /DNA_END=853 /DNA_ORIENTATION=-